MYPLVFEKDGIEYPASQPEGDIKLRGRSWLWVGSGTEKRLPVFKIEIAVEEVEGDKKPMFSGKPGSGVLPQLAQVVAYGMKRKCDQVQSHQCVGQPLFAVSEVMFHVIAVFFQQVKPFVFNLPARARPAATISVALALVASSEVMKRKLCVGLRMPNKDRHAFLLCA